MVADALQPATVHAHAATGETAVVRIALIVVALLFFGLFVFLPLVVVFLEAFQTGLQGFIAAIDSYAFHDVTADLALPRIWHWLALLIGVTGAALSALAMALRREDRS